MVIIKKLWIIILAGIICATGAGLYSKLIMKPVYTSGTTIYVINRQNKDITTYTDLQTGSQLTKDYKLLVKSRPVLEQVLYNLKLKMTQEQLASKITVNTPPDTRILEIMVENQDPLLAKQLADSIAEVSAARMVSVMEMEKVNVVEPGNIPSKPSSPNVLINTMIAGLFGAFLATFIILIFYIMDDSIKTPDDIEKHLGITALGMVPLEITNNRSKRLSKRKNKITKRHALKQKVHPENIGDNYEKTKLDFAGNEAYKTLRTNIQFCGKEVKTICITSCTPNEGKTVISFRLASTIAETGKKVLFIDADLRKSVIIGRLGIEGEVFGLSQYLSGMNSLEEVINETNVNNVDIIFTGPIPPNPSELLGGEMFHNLIRTQREVYDYIIIDTPPLGLVIDSANVAECCDGTMLVVESNSISYKLVQRVLKQLEKGKCRVLGAVLNKVNLHAKGYYSVYYGKGSEKYYDKYKYEN
jgi:capsular exopolysaccharide synthesis family protein